MINKDNFQLVLVQLGFINNFNSVWTKTFDKDIELKVDFEKQSLIYPSELIVNEKQTCNFAQNENFVVFECVHRLLEKGYLPKDIELEKRWSLGHSQKSGRADICVYHNDELLIIIECKTYGTEYNKALKVLKDDGGQLFSYWQQDRSIKWLGLYACDIVNDKIIYKNDIINCNDDENLKQLSQKDESIKIYQNAFNKEQLHKVWQDTYLSLLHQELFFGDDAIAYQIGIKPLRKKDLKDFNPDDKIINQFEEILRHNAVSDKENAFNRLIALFICKLVDEIQKDENSEVEFQYKVGQDTFESLQDRLQRLYTEGMDRFMREEIFYIPNEYAQEIFSRYQGGDRKNAIDELKNTIRKLKFYTNNDFAFKDVHNEALFLQNGKILVEMVQLFEKYRIVYPSKHQFLGDLFEKLLNKGFKQNEGQFFTPSPITRFIWDSLPLQKIIKNDDVYPKVIDYACGSGHFLTEAIEAINATKPSLNNDWVRDSIFGIEKDYRLARVSQVSMFMNGAGNSNIIFGDGLDNDETKGLQNEQFDILVANPPYSVSAFKSHLKLKNNQLTLMDLITNQGGEIEVLFCERIAQLLKSGGVGAVILPSSILSNDSVSYTGARELLLQEFFIHAIVNLGSKTFGATGTNTVILFLEKMNYPPKKIYFAKDHADAIFSQSDLSHWNDGVIYQNYLDKIMVSNDIYNKIRLKTLTWEELNLIDNEYIVLHRELLLPKISLDKYQKQLNIDEQNKIITKKFLMEFEKSEKEKIIFFALTYTQKTLIINAPTDNAKQKEFLGYDWSNRKGAEGIQIIKAGGKLYDDNDRFAKNTLAYYIRQMFEKANPDIDICHQEYAYTVNTVDMLDFSLVNFNKTIRTSIQKKVEIESKYPLVKLDMIVSEIETGSRPKGGVGFINEGVYSLGGEHIGKDNGRLVLKTIKYVPKDFFDNATRGKIKKHDILICKDGALTGKICIVKDELDGIDAMVNEHIFIIRCNNLVTQLYVFEFLYSESGQNLLKANITGSAQGGLNSTNLKNIKIPLPPLDIQQKIIDECQEIDKEYDTSRMSIDMYRQKIADIFNELEVVRSSGGGATLVKISDLCVLLKRGKSAKYGKSNIQIIKSGQARGYQVFDFSTCYYVDDGFVLDERQLQKGDILINSTGVGTAGRVTLFELEGIFVADSHITIFRPNQEKLLPKFGLYSLAHIGFDTIEKMAQGASGQIELSLSMIGGIKLLLPELDKQKAILAQIEQYEQQIQKANDIIQNIAKRKKAVLDRYLT